MNWPPPLPEKCECDVRDEGSTLWHKSPDGCTRPPEKYDNIVCSPALCIPCLYGCYE